jgi:hypothetical protein
VNQEVTSLYVGRERCGKSHTRALQSRLGAYMKRCFATALGGIIRIAGGFAILVAFPAEELHSGIPTIKTPGPYPYETPGQIPAPPPVLDSSPLPSPAPFPYPESSPSPSAAQDHDSRTAEAGRPLSAKAVREAAFKYNGVANFCGFLAALPANVSVYDPKLGKETKFVEIELSARFAALARRFNLPETWLAELACDMFADEPPDEIVFDNYGKQLHYPLRPAA